MFISLAFLTFVNAMTITLPVIVGPHMLEYMNVKDDNISFWSGLLVSAPMCGQILANVIWYRFAKSRGTVYTVILGQFLLCFTLFAQSICIDAQKMLVLKFLQGLSNGNLALVRILVNRKDPTKIPLVVCALLGGVLTGSVLASSLYTISSFDYPPYFVFTVFSALLQIYAGIMFCAWIHEDAEELSALSNLGEHSSPTPQVSYVDLLCRYKEEYGIQACAQFTLYAIDYSIVMGTYQWDISVQKVNEWMIFSNLTAFVVAIVAGKFSTLSEAKHVLLRSCGIYLCVILLLFSENWVSSANSILVAILLRGIGYGVSVMSTSMFMNDVFARTTSMGACLALFQSLTSIMATVSPIVTSTIWSLLENSDVMPIYSLICPTIILVVCALLLGSVIRSNSVPSSMH